MVAVKNLFLFIAFVCCCIWQPVNAGATPWLLINASEGGKVIAQNEATRLWHPASLTKLMTAYTVFREIKVGHIDLKSPVKISRSALANPPSKMGFPVGTVLTIDMALKIIMVKSANDIAHAIGESTSGHLGAFIDLMNKYATQIGMKNSHFTNPHGLPDDAQVVSAKDMAILAMAIQTQFPQYAHYFNIQAIKFGKKRLRNHNRLLTRFPGTNGMKTGYICASGLNIVARAKRGGKELIAVVLGGDSSIERNVLTAKLLQLGFDDYFSNQERPYLEAINPIDTAYRIPANLVPRICKPNWQERQWTKKQRRQKRKEKLAELAAMQKKYLPPASILRTKNVPIKLGRATGKNPHNYKLVNGNTPPPLIAKPVWRPDRTLEPVEG